MSMEWILDPQIWIGFDYFDSFGDYSGNRQYRGDFPPDKQIALWTSTESTSDWYRAGPFNEITIPSEYCVAGKPDDASSFIVQH